MSSGESRIPSLDGLRAISIALVFLGHLVGTKNAPVPAFFALYSTVGVRVFFIISGYLITSILVKEHSRSGTISLREFYVRRVFRIFPAAYVFLTAAVLFAWPTLSAGDIASGYAYVANFNESRPWIIAHLWSLSVEEQFYLLWPLSLLLFFEKGGAIALGGVIMGPVMRVAFKLAGFDSDALAQFFPCVVDSIATGCLLSLCRPQVEKWSERLGGAAFVLILVVAASVPLWPYASHRIGVPAYQLVGITVMNFGIALFVERSIRKRYALLNHPVLVWVGVLSYSLYLWQQPFFNHHSRSWYTAFPVNLLLAVAFASLSYFGIERPFLRLRERLFSRRAPAAPASPSPTS
jgi:peptidoglycan/LPS O-acetylase OafA/YrhL